MSIQIKQFIGRTISKLSRSVGYDFVKLNHHTLGAQAAAEALAAHLKELFAVIGIDTVIDVGANQGQYYEFLRNWVGFKGRVISFEPIPSLSTELKARSSSDPLWTVCGYAIGSRDEMSTIKIAERSGWSSLLDKASHQSTDVADSVVIKEVVPIQVHRLDTVLPQLIKDDQIGRTYLKIDAQGFDLEVLRGMGQLLDRVPALQTELGLISVYENEPSFIEVLAFLESNKFGLTVALPLWHDSSLRVGELDTVFRNRRSIA